MNTDQKTENRRRFHLSVFLYALVFSAVKSLLYSVF